MEIHSAGKTKTIERHLLTPPSLLLFANTDHKRVSTSCTFNLTHYDLGMLYVMVVVGLKSRPMPAPGQQTAMRAGVQIVQAELGPLRSIQTKLHPS